MRSRTPSSCEQRNGVLLRSAVSEQLDEDVLANPGRHPSPQRDAVAGRPTVAGQFADLDARHERRPPLPKIERQRAGNHQQVAGHLAVRRHRSPGVVRLRPRRIVLRPVDRVDDACLCRRRRRRQREIGVAAEPPQQRDLVVEPARTAVRQGVVERPIAVDEAERGCRRRRGAAARV